MIRVANLMPSVSRASGGLFDAVRRLAQSLALAGTEQKVVGLCDASAGEDLKDWSPVSVSAFKPFGPAQFGYSPHFLTALEEFCPQVAHTHGLWLYASVATHRYSRRQAIPYVVSPHGMLDPWALEQSYWKKRIARALFENAHLRDARVLRALCEAEARSIRQLGLNNEIAIIPNGVDLPATPLDSPSPWKGIVSPECKVLLFLSRIHPKKGLVHLLHSWAALKPRPADWVLAIAGWDQGGHEAELKRLAGELGLKWSDARDSASHAGVVQKGSSEACSVVFLGPQFNENKLACYQNCSAFVLPSFSEGVPMVVLEAWAFSKAVLMTPQCNLPSGFTEGAALKAEPVPESLGQGLRELLAMSDAQRQLMGARGRALVEAQFSWSCVADQMKGLYEWMLGGGDKPGSLARF